MANQEEIVIFGELDESNFAIVETVLKKRYSRVMSGQQGDNWIWVFYRGGKIEIDTFYSHKLEIRGARKQFGLVHEIINLIHPLCSIKVFDPPKVDETRN